MTDKVWLITGCSSGFGRALAERVLEKGGRVVVTARDTGSVEDIVAKGGDRAIAVALDITKDADIAATVAAAEKAFGRIDVLVNNAGYGYQASAEESVDAEIRAQFDTNVFGLFAMTRAVLPVMRRQRSGSIINITSLAGLMGLVGSGYYGASKHAIEGWSDSLRGEVGPLGIGVTCVEPGAFRTDWAGRSLRRTPSVIEDYAETAAKRQKLTASVNGKQEGDPVRAADIMIDVANQSNPPRHLVLGAGAYDMVTAKLEERLAEIRSLRETALAADFPDA